MQNLEHSLKLNMTVPVYLFWGEEDLLMEEYIRKVSHVVAPDGESWSVETYHGDEASPDEILFALASSGLFAARKLVVVRDAPWFKKKNKTDEDSAKEEKDAVVKQLIQYCADPNPDIVLILTARNIIKTSKLVKAIAAAGRVVEFSCPKGAEREIWLANYFKNCGKMPEKGVCAYVSLMCGEGLGLLKGEADKLLLYAGDHSHITMADAEQVVSTSALAGVFELTDLAAARNAAGAVNILRRLLKQGEAGQMLLVMLSNQYHNMLAVKDMQKRGYSVNEIPKVLGIHPFVVKKCAQQGTRYTFRELMNALEVLLKADVDSKSGGSIDDLLETAVLRICGGK